MAKKMNINRNITEPRTSREVGKLNRPRKLEAGKKRDKNESEAGKTMKTGKVEKAG